MCAEPAVLVLAEATVAAATAKKEEKLTYFRRIKFFCGS